MRTRPDISAPKIGLRRRNSIIPRFCGLSNAPMAEREGLLNRNKHMVLKRIISPDSLNPTFNPTQFSDIVGQIAMRDSGHRAFGIDFLDQSCSISKSSSCQSIRWHFPKPFTGPSAPDQMVFAALVSLTVTPLAL